MMVKRTMKMPGRLKSVRFNRLITYADFQRKVTSGYKGCRVAMVVERRNAMRQTEKLKAELRQAMVNYEMKVQEANAEVYRRQKSVETYEQEKAAEGRRATAEAEFFARQKEADALLYAKQKKAEGLVMLASDT